MGESEKVSVRNVTREWPVMLATFLIVLVGLSYYVSSMPVRYASGSVVAFQPKPGRADGRDLVSLLVQTYPQFVASQQAVDAAAAAAGVPSGDVRSGLDVQIPPLTLTMTIQTELADPQAAQIANQALLDQVIEQAKTDPFLVATAISEADRNDTPSGVPRRLLYALAAVLAAGTAVLAGIVASRLRGSRRKPDANAAPD